VHAGLSCYYHVTLSCAIHPPDSAAAAAAVVVVAAAAAAADISDEVVKRTGL